MIRLKGAHRGDRAAVILGGPSLVARDFDFPTLRDKGFVTFVETKALTPRLLEHGFSPDYYLLLFPEKSKDNALQHFVYRSLLANTAIEPMLKPEYRRVPRLIRQHFDEYFDDWKPERGPHKTYRWKPDVFLPGSPYDLLARAPQSRVIANRKLVDAYFPGFAYADRTFYFEQELGAAAFDTDAYFNPAERDGTIFIRCADTFLNSAAIALYPILNYMGFREVYFVGMDMSMLGSMEYAAPFTFRSMVHFWWFFQRSRRVFNSNYISNGWLFKRPQSEFDDMRHLWAAAPLKFVRVYDPWRYATPIENLATISTERLQTM